MKNKQIKKLGWKVFFQKPSTQSFLFAYKKKKNVWKSWHFLVQFFWPAFLKKNSNKKNMVFT